MDNRPWMKSYPSGIPANIDPSKYNTLVEFLEECFTKWGPKPAFHCMGRTLSFKELDKYSADFGAYLQSRGLKKGDRVAIMMPNLIQYPIAIFGVLRAGMIAVNTNPLYTPREMKHQFNDSGVKAVIIAENFCSNLEKIIGETSIEIVITTTIGEMLGMVKGAIVDFVIRRVKKMVPKFQLTNTVKMNDALKAGSKFSINPFDSGPEDVILHQYTGGTTGVSKGAMLTHRNMVSNMLQMEAWMSRYLEYGNETALSPLPMYHIFAFSVNCLAMMKLGAKTVLVVNPRDLSSISKEFKNHKISLMTGVNTLFNALVHNEGFKKSDTSSLKVTVGGGMAVQKAVAENWLQVTGCRLSEGYGMTESSPVVTINPFDETARLGSIGLPVPSTDVRLVDDHGNILGIGEIGELQVKGPQVMKGYYNKPEETAKTILDGWLCTGDMATMDNDGFFNIVDRKKDMILVSGFNVYPNEVEDVLAMHPKIMEVGAIGAPDEKSGEVVKVYIVKKDKSLTEKEVIEYAKENLTGYKVPKMVRFIKEMPKTNVGKILRKELKTMD
ncbi:MAG TPA: AMP-binding protein [Saprospiraceae bacterium]|nr:AMP-binding protein [Saprospiraceae bacterium]